MSPLRLNGSTSGFSQLDAPAIAGDQTFTLPGTGGTIDRLNRAGNILQVVNATYSTSVSSSSSTFADTGLTATITPSSATSKILVFANLNGVYKTTNNTAASFRLLRASTVILLFEDLGGANNTITSNAAAVSTCYLDSPTTTSATAYKIQFASAANNASVLVNNYYSTINGSTSTITLLEVAA